MLSWVTSGLVAPGVQTGSGRSPRIWQLPGAGVSDAGVIVADDVDVVVTIGVDVVGASVVTVAAVVGASVVTAAAVVSGVGSAEPHAARPAATVAAPATNTILRRRFTWSLFHRDR